MVQLQPHLRVGVAHGSICGRAGAPLGGVPRASEGQRLGPGDVVTPALHVGFRRTEGSLGLWQGILSYQNGDFETHAKWWIRQYLARAIVLQARESGFDRKMKQAMEDYRSVDERLLTELGRNATVEEIAEAMHISAEEGYVVASMLESARMLSRAKQEMAEPEEDDPEDEQHVEDTALFQSRQRIAELLSNLSEEESKLLSLRFGLEGGMPLSPEETGRKLGLTPEEVVAKEAAALAKMRNN